MIQNRIALLKKFIEEDPSDPFNVYALALEYIDSNPEKANELFEQLLKEHPSYLPTYYQAAHFFANAGMNDRAIEIAKAGMELAKAQGNNKTLSELNSLLDELAL